MPVHNSKQTHAPGLPELPGIVRDFVNLKNAGNESELYQQLNDLNRQYPEFFESLLNIINSDYLNLTNKVRDVMQAVSISGLQSITQLVIMQVTYLTISQYKISGLDQKIFWQDIMRRAVCARLTGELSGLSASQCFYSGFFQDIGFILLFFEQPDKGVLWTEFHKREPDARYHMERRIFNEQHDEKLRQFLLTWELSSDLQEVVCGHHHCNSAKIKETDKKICKVLNSADWLSAVYTADGKSYVINRCRKLLLEEFDMDSSATENLLASIPDEVNLMAKAFGFELQNHVTFEKTLYQANICLNEDNDRFQLLTLRLDQAIDERDRLAAELDRDLNMAREIQQSLLPASREDDFPVHGINLSAKVLSGDFYDFFELDNGDIYFNLGDVSGKGVNAALLMAKTSSLFRCLGKRIDQPEKLLYEINHELCETSIHGMFVTMIAGIYQREQKRIKLVNAGHPPALLFTQSEMCREYIATAPPLGVIHDAVFTEYIIDLQQGSLYIYSDGVTEGFIDDSTELGLSGLFKLIANMNKNLSAVDRLNSITDRFRKTSLSLRDDITILVVDS